MDGLQQTHRSFLRGTRRVTLKISMASSQFIQAESLARNSPHYQMKNGHLLRLLRSKSYFLVLLSDLIENTATMAWPNEPYTRASYAALAPGEVTAHWKTLFEPTGRLFFAGEHSTPIQGFMEGAVESGQRAARTILAT